MIPRCEDIFPRNVQQTRKLSQRRPLVIIGVTKTQINPVALVSQLGMACARPPDKIRYTIHLFLAFGGEPFDSFEIVDQTRFGLIRNEIHEFSQDGTSRRKQVGMIARATLVPITERFPFLANPSRTKNVSLGGENEIRTNR